MIPYIGACNSNHNNQDSKIGIIEQEDSPELTFANIEIKARTAILQDFLSGEILYELY